MPLHVSSTCAHHQEIKITLHSLWYHHTHIPIGGRLVYDSPRHQSSLTPLPMQYFLFSFLLEAESTRRLQRGRKNYVKEKLQ